MSYQVVHTCEASAPGFAFSGSTPDRAPRRVAKPWRPLAGIRLFALLCVALAPAWLAPSAALAQQSTLGIRAENPTVVGDGESMVVFIWEVTGVAIAEPHLSLNAEAGMAVDLRGNVWDGVSPQISAMNGGNLSYTTRELMPGAASIDVTFTITSATSEHRIVESKRSATVTVIAPPPPTPTRIFLSNEDEVATTPGLAFVHPPGNLSHLAQEFTTGPLGMDAGFIPRTLTLWFGDNTPSNLQDSELTVAIWRNDAVSGGPGICAPPAPGGACASGNRGKYITFDNPESDLGGGGEKVFTYSESDDLGRNAVYHLVVEYRGAETVELHHTNTADATENLEGWSIGVNRSGEDGIWAAFSVPQIKLRFKLEGVRKDAEATGEPSVSGSPWVGQVLTAARGTLADPNGLPTSDADYSYQWLRYEANSNTFVETGMTGTSYTVIAADVDKRLGVRASFRDEDNYQEAVESGPATRVVTATAPMAPGAPTGLTATAGTLSIVLGWTAPASEGDAAITGYRIERASGDCSGTPSFTDLEANTGNTDLTYTDTGLTAGAEFCYQVSAINLGGTGAASNTDSATAAAAAIPMTPDGDTIFISNTGQTTASGGIAANDTNSRAQSFRTGSAASGYNISNVVLTLFSSYGGFGTSILEVQLRNDDGGHPGDTVIANFDRPSTNIARGDATFPLRSGDTALLEPDTTYHLYVARNSSTGISLAVSDNTNLDSMAAGWSVPHRPSTLAGGAWRREASIGYMKFQIQGSEATAAAAPGAPTGLTATAGTLSIVLGWTAPASDGGAAITGYRIERASGDCSGAPSFTDLEANTGNTDLTYTDTGLTAGAEFCYQVSAINLGGTGAASNTDSATAAAAAGPTPTTLPLVSNTGVAADWIAQPNRDTSYAQPFTTGDNSGGYNLDSIVLSVAFGLEFEVNVPVVVTLRAEDAGFPSTNVLYTLTTVTPQSQYLASRDNAGVAQLSFRAPSNAVLMASTTYYVVVEQATDPGGRRFRWRQAPLSNGLDAGTAAGWTLDDTFRVFSSGAWGPSDRTTHAHQIQVRGSAVGGPVLPVVRVASAETVTVFNIETVTVGDDVVFVFTRDITAGPLTVNIAWSETSGLANMSPPTSVMFEGGAAEARLELRSGRPAGLAGVATAELTLQPSTGYPATAAYVTAGRRTVGVNVRAQNTPATGNTVVTGTVRVGEEVSLGAGTFADADSSIPGDIARDDLAVDDVDLQWQREDPVGTWDDIPGSNAMLDRYTLVAADAGKRIRITMSYTDGRGYDEEVISIPTPFVAAMGAAAPAANTEADGTPTISGTLQVDEELTAETPTSGAGAITDANGPSPLPAASFSYQWRRADDAVGMNAADISGATDAAYTLVAADEGKHIRVVVSFIDAAGYDERVESDWTSEAVAAAPMPTMTAPGAPTGLTATAGPLSIRLGWTAPGDDGGAAITGYRIERASGDCSDSPAFTERVADTGSADPRHTDTSLTAGETWCYRVSAINSEGEGAASNTASATADAAPATMTAPGAPTGLTATAGPLSIRLGWTAPGDDGGAAIIGYRIERASGDCSGSPAFTDLVADTGSTGTSHTDMNLSAGEDWCYRVSAINAAGAGAASNTAFAMAGAAPVVVTAPVTPPTGLSASSDVGQIRLGWTAPSDDGGSPITGYRIERASGDCSVSPAFMERVADTGSAGTSHTDTGLTTGETWCYRVSAINAEGRSPVSGTESALVLAAGEVEVELAHAALEIAEGDADATLEITVTVSPAPVGELSIPYQVVAATGAAQQATADADFTLPAGPLLIAAGESSGVITATISADNISEPAEGFALMLGAPTSSNAGETPSLGGRSGAEVLIAANDPLMFTLTASEEPVSEGESVTYTLAPAAEGPELAAGVELEFAWALSGGDATAGDDYRTEPADTYTGAFTFSAADAAAMTVSVDIVLDNVVENEEDETFLFSVTTPANAAAETGGLTLTPADGVLTTTITNVVDLPPVFSGVRVQNQLWTQGVPVSLELPTATGGNGELNYTLTPQLPRGLLLNDRIISGAPNVETAATTYRWKVTDSDTNVEDSDSAALTFTIQVQDVETHEDQVHAATHAALALLAPNLASGAVQVLTTRFESLGAPGRQNAARNTLSLGGKPLGAFADEAGSGLDVAREVASFFGFHLPQTYQYGDGGGAFAAGGGGGYGAAGGGVGGYGAAGHGASGTGGAAGGGYGGAGTGGAGVTGTGAAVGNAGGASAELAFAPATQGALEAEATENNTGGRGADEAGDWRSQRLDSWLGVGAFQSPDLRSLLSQSSFSVTFGPALGPAHGAADDPGAAADGLFGGRWTLWGQGAADGFEGRDKASALWVEGESISAYLGADVQRDGLALGVALGRNTGDLDYRDAAGRGSGDLKTELTSLHPYLNWSPNPGFNMYLLLGYGVGEGKLEVENLPSKLSSDLEMRMVALGGRRTLAGSATGRRYEIKVDAFLVELESEGAEAAPGGVNWRAVDTQSGRLRMALAGAAPLLEGVNHLLAEGELAARLDGGDAQSGIGAELGAGLRWLRGDLSLAARGRLLLVHSESDFEDYKEWGASLEASYDAGEVGRGFRATLSPVWGDAGSGAGALYESAGALRGFAAGGASQGRRGLLPDHLNLEFGYGVGLLGGRALLSPFGSFTFAAGEASDTRLRLGARFDLSHAVGGGAFAVQRLGFELFGEQQAGAARERRFGVELNLGF